MHTPNSRVQTTRFSGELGKVEEGGSREADSEASWGTDANTARLQAETQNGFVCAIADLVGQDADPQVRLAGGFTFLLWGKWNKVLGADR